jgi:histidine triad (HIT) family protein
MTETRVGEGHTGDDFYGDVALPSAVDLQVRHEDEWILAFHHTRPYWQEHVVVVPKRHVAALSTLGAEVTDLVTRVLVDLEQVAGALEQRHGAASVVTNLGAYQDSKHLHVHLHSGGRRRAS